MIAGDTEEMAKSKRSLARQLEIKDLDKVRYFLCIKIAKSGGGFFICQLKCFLDLLGETNKLDCNLLTLPLKPITGERLWW